MTPTEQQEPPMRNRITENHEPQEADMTTPTRSDLITQRAAKAAELAALDAQLAAMPETVRVYAWAGAVTDTWYFSSVAKNGFGNHYRDFPLINGVPEGFVKVEER